MHRNQTPAKESVAILAITPPQQVKDIRKFLGMVQYYGDLWTRCSKMLAPLTSARGEYGHTKATKTKETKRSWYWDTEYQKSFYYVKTTIPKDVTLASPDYSL